MSDALGVTIHLLTCASFFLLMFKVAAAIADFTLDIVWPREVVSENSRRRFAKYPA